MKSTKEGNKKIKETNKMKKRNKEINNKSHTSLVFPVMSVFGCEKFVRKGRIIVKSE